MNAETQLNELIRTPLHPLHLKLGARMGPFAGYDLPLFYGEGVLEEHKRTRIGAGLFDVSHMGQLTLRPKSGVLEDAALALERLVPADIAGLEAGRQRYTYFTNTHGGILDDLMVTNRGSDLYLVVNGACKDADESRLREALSATCDIERIDNALIALQGPKAEAALARLAPDCVAMRFMDSREPQILGKPCVVSRSGYTGEDGYEISLPSEIACAVAEALLKDPEVIPAGLAARDTLRLEAGLCLYGADIDETTTPVAAGISWAIGPARRQGGAREGGFPGTEPIFAELAGGPAIHRVGLTAEGRTPIRAGASIYADETSQSPVGRVTSGGFGPTVGRPVAMGYVPIDVAPAGSPLFAEVRGKRLPVTTAPLPFIKHRYKRN